MIKVFTTEQSSKNAGEILTKQYEDWVAIKNQEKMEVDVMSIHSNSNKFGWMLVVHYTLRYIG
jgi:hypothetical protein